MLLFQLNLAVRKEKKGFYVKFVEITDFYCVQFVTTIPGDHDVIFRLSPIDYDSLN
jgi:hypothetical protein